MADSQTQTFCEIRRQSKDKVSFLKGQVETKTLIGDVSVCYKQVNWCWKAPCKSTSCSVSMSWLLHLSRVLCVCLPLRGAIYRHQKFMSIFVIEVV